MQVLLEILFFASAVMFAAAVYYLVLGLWGWGTRALSAAEDEAPEGAGALRGFNRILVRQVAGPFPPPNKHQAAHGLAFVQSGAIEAGQGGDPGIRVVPEAVEVFVFSIRELAG